MDDGIVLVTVMWLLGLLGALASAMAIYTTGRVGTLDAFSQRLAAGAALEGGLNRAFVAMSASQQSSGRDVVALGSTRIGFSWTAETARIDINYAPAPLLAGLFARLGATPDQAAGYADLIVGLRGFPPEPARMAGNAFHADETPAAIYAAAHRLDTKPDPHRPFTDASQLAGVAGLPPALMTRASPFLTTFSGVATIDPRICAPEVIDALPDMTRERVRTLMRLRAEGGDLDDALGTAKVFTSTKPASTVRFHVDQARPGGVGTAAEIVVVTYDRDRVPFRVVAWEEEPPSLSPDARN